MRTLSRRGFMAGAMTVLAPLAGSTPVFADQASDSNGSVRTRADSATEISDSAVQVASREQHEKSEPTAEEKRATLGTSIVDFALSYLGYPYVAAGNSPYGFDCSGFTQFVYLNVLGVDIGHGVEGQPAASQASRSVRRQRTRAPTRTGGGMRPASASL